MHVESATSRTQKEELSVEKLNTNNLEVCLKNFVNWSLEQSYSNQQIDTNLLILDCAWKAQKLLWQLRQYSTV
jgi:hypothetical protein